MAFGLTPAAWSRGWKRGYLQSSSEDAAAGSPSDPELDSHPARSSDAALSLSSNQDASIATGSKPSLVLTTTAEAAFALRARVDYAATLSTYVCMYDDFQVLVYINVQDIDTYDRMVSYVMGVRVREKYPSGNEA